MSSSVALASLSDLIKSISSEKLLEKLREFSCHLDNDVQTFIHDKAFGYEISGLSRTFIYTLSDTDASLGFSIAAYFTTAITSVDFSEISKSFRERVLGGTPGRNNQNHFGGLLIAQLARNDSYGSEVLSGETIVGDCEHIIHQGRRFLAGKVIYLDSKEALIGFYEHNGYKVLGDSPVDSGLYRMFKVLPKLI
jgi:hypothetical protein